MATGDSHDSEEVQRVLQTRAQTRAFYNKIARVYDLLAERSERPMRQAGLRLLAARPGERILELGPGTGHCLAELARAVAPGGAVYGADLAESMCRLARRLLVQEELAGHALVTCADAVRLPFAPRSMDGVFLSFTLELFDTPEIPAVLGECRRVLRAGGRLVVVAVSKEGTRDLAVRAFEWTHRHLPNLVDCRPIYAARAITEAGFVVKATEHQRMWVPVEIVLAIRP